MSASLPVITVTAGDPAGIGPEIVGRLFNTYEPARSRALLVGAADVLTPWLDRADLAVVTEASASTDAVAILDTGCMDSFPCGKDSEGGGRHAGRSLEVAMRAALDGVVEAIVTAPISKHSLVMAGYPYPGHTDWLAETFDALDGQMMMAVGDFRVVPVTRHIPLAHVPAQLTGDKILTALRVVHRALVDDFGIPRPRLAVAGLNPHAGEGGVLGREELDVIAPALQLAEKEGLMVEGPYPADALFQHAQSGTFDAFITMYHDQGLIPFKMLAQRRGVNVTVGLPIIRTSVDHGAAFDIAGQGIAGTESLQQAYLLAEELVTRRRSQS